MTGGTTMNHLWYDRFATDGTTYLRVGIAILRSLEHVQKPCRDRFCYYDRPRPIRQVVRCFCDLSTILTILDRTLVVTWS